jgi:endonuclease YncB( thermonuclease family)
MNMRNLIQALLILFLLIFCENIAGKNVKDNQVVKQSQDYYVKVVGITDGDTFNGLTSDKQLLKIRIYGIDAPEKNQAFGTRSKQYLSNLIFGKQICIKFQLTKKGKHKRSWDRYIAWAYTPDGKDVSAEMLKAGMAWHYKKYDSMQEEAKLENGARKAKIGLWVDKNPVAPWNFRKKKVK